MVFWKDKQNEQISGQAHIKKKRERIQINKIRKEREKMTTTPTDKQKS